jgi:hypothetical protein
MQARILVIEEKRKNDPGAVRPSDFKARDGGAIDPQVILHHPQSLFQNSLSRSGA